MKIPYIYYIPNFATCSFVIFNKLPPYMQLYHEKSLVRTILGYNAFGTGVLGAATGGIKEKEKKYYTSFLIFTYKNTNSLNYIAFEVNNTISTARKFVDDFKELIKKANP